MFRYINYSNEFWTSVRIPAKFQVYLTDLFGQPISELHIFPTFWCVEDIYSHNNENNEWHLKKLANELLNLFNNVLKVIRILTKSEYLLKFKDFSYSVITLVYDNFNYEETRKNFFHGFKDCFFQIKSCFKEIGQEYSLIKEEKNETYQDYLFKSKPENFSFSYLEKFSADYFKNYSSRNNDKTKNDFETIWSYLNQMDYKAKQKKIFNHNFDERNDKFIEKNEKIIQMKIVRLQNFFKQNKTEITDLYSTEKFLNEDF